MPMYRAMKAVFVSLFVTSLVWITPADALEIGDTDVQLTVDSTFASKFIWFGYNAVDDPSWQPSVTADWNNFFVGVWGQFAMTGGYESGDELDYYFGYKNSVYEDSRYALNYTLKYNYIDFPNSDSKAGDDGVADRQEIVINLTWDNLIHVGAKPLILSYTAAYEWEGKDADARDYSPNWFHVVGFGYNWDITPLLDGQEKQSITAMFDTVYNDGVLDADHDWSHSTLSLSTTFERGDLYITPKIAHQWSYEDTVNEDDEFYGQISVGYRF